jgi:hypothetical protein
VKISDYLSVVVLVFLMGIMERLQSAVQIVVPFSMLLDKTFEIAPLLILDPPDPAVQLIKQKAVLVTVFLARGM